MYSSEQFLPMKTAFGLLMFALRSLLLAKLSFATQFTIGHGNLVLEVGLKLRIQCLLLIIRKV